MISTPQNFISTGGTTGTVNLNSNGGLGEQCCVGLNGTFDGGFSPGDIILSTHLAPLTITFNAPVQMVGTQIQDGNIGDFFTAEILAYNGSVLLGTFTENGFSGDLGDNSNIFLGVQDATADITEVVYLNFNSNPTFQLQSVAINQLTIAAPPVGVPGPIAGAGLPGLIFAGSGLLVWWHRRRKASVSAGPDIFDAAISGC
jgi:hypothetical protein